MSKDATIVRWAALNAALAIAAGAFGAHAVAGTEPRGWLQTGASYQLVHAVAAIAIAARFPRQALLMLGGAALFAATLYAMAIGAPRWLGAVTPVGGVAMIAAWLWMAIGR